MRTRCRGGGRADDHEAPVVAIREQTQRQRRQESADRPTRHEDRNLADVQTASLGENRAEGEEGASGHATQKPGRDT